MKGFTNNPNGRPKGTPNNTTKDLKETVMAFLANNMEDLQKNYNQLDARDRLLFFEKLLRYAMPTQAAVKADMSYKAEQQQTIIIKGKKFAEKEGLEEVARIINSDSDERRFIK